MEADSIQILPPLREDLRLMQGAPDEDGAPRWLMFDALRNRYFAISKEAFYLLGSWESGVTAQMFAARLQAQGQPCAVEEVVAFVDFLIGNQLVCGRDEQSSARFLRQQAARQVGFWKWLVHHYLFIRIPLLRPDTWLERVLPRVEWLFSPWLHYGVLVFGMSGVALVLRQWDQFARTFLHFFTLEGMFYYALALILVKSAHELGHALVSKRLGCRVASMGVAFLVLFPVLYTDTTDAWRLTSRFKRLRIVTAGVRVELYLALLATFAWNLLPDGPARSVAFFIATTSWVTSLLVNISPFMRFDGYYAFSDWIGIENLQFRAFELGRWYLRRLLLGLDDPVPEPLPLHRARIMLAYAWATWIYRFFLFLGIAVLVYHLFFKVLGIVLFIVEILWFILFPMLNELKVWWRRRADLVLSPQRLLALGVALAGVLWLLLPIRTSVYIPAVLKAQQEQHYFAPEPARIAKRLVNEGDWVEAGQLLVQLESQTLQTEREKYQIEIDLVESRLMRSAGSQQDKESLPVLRSQLLRLQERVAGLDDQLARLAIRAHQAGRVVQLEPLGSGEWVGTDRSLLSVVDPRAGEIEGYVQATELELIEIGDHGRFLANTGQMRALNVSIAAIDLGATATLDYPELTSLFGGTVDVRTPQQGHWLPQTAVYRVRFTVEDIREEMLDWRQPGVVGVEGAARSWLWFQLRRMFTVLIRESGF